MKKFIVFISILLVFLSFNAYAMDKVAQTGCGFLDVGAGARACGMGEAFTVLGQDATALFYNPSGIGEIDGSFDLCAGGTQWIADINYIYVATVYDAGTWGNFGFSLIAPDYGEFYGTVVTADGAGYDTTGTFNVSAFCAGVSYAREFTDKFTVGIQAKYVSQFLGENEKGDSTGYYMEDNRVWTPSFDFGLLFYPGFKSFAFGMSVRNFSPRVTYERLGFELPLTFALGVGMDVLDLLGDHPDYSFNVGADMLHPRDWQEQYHLGGEFGFKDMIFLRAGYKFGYSEEGYNVGFGIGYAGIRLDYSYSQFDLFDDDMVNRFSVGMAF
ncbi:MAG: PorV/PorQ family protein [candidate division WOR-3 bacterium]|jgi:hypothetical protein